MTNLVQFPGLGLSFQLNRVAFTIGGVSIYWYGVCIAVGLCLALVFAFRHSLEFGVDPDSMVDAPEQACACERKVRASGMKKVSASNRMRRLFYLYFMPAARAGGDRQR